MVDLVHTIILKFFWKLGRAMLIRTRLTSGKIPICVKSVKLVRNFIPITCISVAVRNLFDFVLLRSVIIFIKSLKFALCFMTCYVILWSTIVCFSFYQWILILPYFKFKI